jgi:DNA-binding CsgD family transcriptional regulator
LDGAYPAGLTQRELDVLRLLAQRLSNPEIAEALFVGPRTVQTHVEHIFAKLGVNNRRDAAEAAARFGLV